MRSHFQLAFFCGLALLLGPSLLGAQQSSADTDLEWMQNNCLTDASAYKAYLWIQTRQKVRSISVKRLVDIHQKSFYSFSSQNDYDEYLLTHSENTASQSMIQSNGFFLNDFQADRIFPGFQWSWVFPEFLWKACTVDSGREYPGSEITLGLVCFGSKDRIYLNTKPGERVCPSKVRVYNAEGFLLAIIDYDWQLAGAPNQVRLKSVQVISVVHQWITSLDWQEFY